jgi:hypothetical protein
MRTNKLAAGMLMPVLLCIAIAGCDDSGDSMGPQPDKEALGKLFIDGVSERTQHFTLSAATGGNITAAKGTIVKFGSNAFQKLNGDPVTGSVDIKLIEIYDRSTMLLTKRHTNGKNDDNKIDVLISGGEFYVNATQDGMQLKPASGYTIVAPTKNTGEIDQDMRLFTGAETCVGDDCDVIWEENKDRGIEIGEFQTTGGFQTAYFCFQSHFGWTNIDRWFNDPRQKTTIFVDVPEGFDNSNCVVFIAYEGEPTALGRFDRYDESSKMFTEHYGLVPIGIKIHVILISIVDEVIHYAVQSSTVTEDHVVTIDDVESISEEALIDLIDELP